MENKKESVKQLLIAGCMLLGGLVLVIVSMLPQVRGGKLAQILTAVGAGLMFGGYVTGYKQIRAKKEAKQETNKDEE